jgi:hypothetical protein
MSIYKDKFPTKPKNEYIQNLGRVGRKIDNYIQQKNTQEEEVGFAAP